MSLNTNITNLQEVLNKVNTLPTAENLEDELDFQSILISEQNAKIAELANILANKAGGSSGQDIKYDTCTIYLSPDGGALFGYCVTCFDGKKVLQRYNFSTNDLGSIAIEDAICGSTFAIISRIDNGGLYANNATKVGSINSRGAIFIAPTQPGDYATIQIGNDEISHSGGGM